MRTSRFASAIRNVQSGWLLVLWATHHPVILLRLFCLGFLLSGGPTVAPAQTPANIENGFKPYGSYDGANLDTINVMNGNLMLHVPMPWTYPQRGSDINPHNLLTVTSKTWHEQCNSNNNAPPTCYWTNGWGLQQVLALTGTGLGFDHTMDMALHRVWQSQSGSDGNGPTSYSSFGYYLNTADGSTHQLWSSPSGPFDPNGDPLALESIDTTGFHVTLTNIGSDGTPSGAVVTDRQGNQNLMGKWAGPCTHSTSNGYNGSTTTVTCTQFASIASITDVNGNIYTVWNGSGSEDTMGRPFLSSSSSAPASNSAAEQCVGGGLTVTSATTFTYPGPGSATNQITACYATLDISTAFGVSGILEAQNAPGAPQLLTAQVLVTLIMADSTKWTFSYDSYMDVTQVGLPLGGSISYTWTTVSTSSNCGANKSRAVTSRTLNDNNGHVFTWNYSWGTPGNTSLTNTMTDPLGNDVAHVFSALDVNSQGVGCTFYETSTQYYQGTGSGRQLLKQIDTTYSSAILLDQSGGGADLGNVVATSIKTTVYPTGEVSLVTKSYDSGLGANAPIFGQVVTEKDYDFGQGSPGALLREVDTSYEWQVNSAYLAAQLLEVPASVVTKDGNGNRVAETDYTYDESQYLTSSNINMQHGAAPNSVRGNLTTVSKWLNTSSNPIVSHNNWYDTGEVYQQIDALGNTTTHSYDPYYIGAYSTRTCNPLSQCVSGTYDFTTALITSFTDANSSYGASGNTPGDPAHTSNYTYDFMSRITLAQLPPDPSGNRPQTSFQYPVPITLPFTATKTKSITPSLGDSVSSTYDGLGRVYKAQHSLPNGTAEVDTAYDGLDHVVSVTNPYFSTSDPTYGVTRTQYDALGRVTQTTKQDNSVVTLLYNQTSANSPNGDCTTTTDEAGKQRKSCLDGLSRLIEVDEPQASSGSMSNPYVTLYSYDALGNLLSVNQKGDGSQAARARTFNYDSLSRLLTATNPESGQISYSYDANGNVLQKTSPAPNQTGSATQTISYCYDRLNRVTGRAYLAQSCPLSSAVVTYSYDSGTNGIGRLTGLTDQAGPGSYSYDALGRMGTEQRTIAGNSKTLSYTYNLDGSVATLTYPSGAVVTYTPDTAGRALSAVDSGNNINYVTAAIYGPDNSLTGFLGGQSTTFAGISNSFSYNPRLQPVNMAAVAPDCTGTGCSASVTISGGLQIAPTSGGTIPLPTTGTKMVGFQEANGTPHAFYLSTNQHIIHLFQGNSGIWQAYDVTANTISGNTTNHLPAASTPLTGLANPGGHANSFYFLDANQHIHETYDHNDNVWRDNDMTALFGLIAAASNSSLLAYPTSNSIDMHLHWVGTDQHIHDLHHNNVTGWSDMDVTANCTSGNTTNHQPASGTALTGLADPSGLSNSFYFPDANQHIHESYDHNNEVWTDNDFMTLFGVGAAAAGTPLVIHPGAGSIDMHLHYIGADGHNHDFYHNPANGWANMDVTANSINGNTTNHQPESGTSLTGLLNPGGGATSFYFFDASQHMHETYDHNDEVWHDNDFMTLFGLNAAAQGTALISYPASGSNPPSGSIDMHLHYLGPNQHIYDEYHNNSTGWFSQDVNTAAQLDAPDSGTVSLTVGGFTATACFGPSSNPACTGQRTNNGPNDVAAALATALNASGSPVAATASGATITMTWTATGSTATPVSPLSTTHDNPTLFPAPSFTSQAASFGGGTGGTLPVFNITYNFNLGNGDNGNVIGITNNRDTTRSQSFTCDALNRLTSAQNAGTNCNQMTANGKTEYWGNSYGYDSWGNLLQKNVTKCSAENLSVSALSNNQLSGYGYDAAGNMTHDATTGNTYAFDQENRITGAAGYMYTYDSDGNRVEKSIGGVGTIYWYMSPGVVAESDLSGNLKSEYIFFDGERVARKDFAGNTASVAYYFSDHLKTASVITNSAGVITEDEDYYPWGGELQFVNSDSNHYKLTGKERDSETGLDYFGARYYGNWYGRFLSADWAAKPEAVPYSDLHDPQSLNLYSYVRNVPTSQADPDGHQDGLGALIREYFRKAWESKSDAENGSPAMDERPAPAQLRAADAMLPTAVEGSAKGFILGATVADALAPGLVSVVKNIAIGDYKNAALGAAIGPVWKLGSVARGVAIERALGANLPGTFPVIDKFANGVATSIKSIDLTAKTYQNAEALASKINGYVDKLGAFNGAKLGQAEVKASEITSRQLQLAVPAGSITSAQQSVINAATTRAEKMGVSVTVTQVH